MKNIVLKNGTVIDGTLDSTSEIKDILIENKKIRKVGNLTKKELKNAKVIDCSGMYIMPGLINMHAHLFGTGKPSSVLGGGFLQKIVILFTKTSIGHKILDVLVKSAVQQELYSGVTTLRTVGDFEYSDIRIRDKVREGEIVGPRMFCSGPAITVPTGHGDGTFATTKETPEELREEVRIRVKQGADFIKICTTGGVMDAKEKGHPGELKMSLEQTLAVTNEAHKNGLIVASHTESPEGMTVAINGGVDTIEHSSPFTDDEAKILKDRNGALIITCSPAVPLAKLPGSVTKLSDFAQFNSQVVLNNMINGAKIAKEKGIQIGLGTDASCPFTTQYNMWRELLFYKKLADVTEKDAIYAATLSNAKILGIDDITGSIHENKYADILVLKENPLENLEALREPTYIFLEGKKIRMRPKKNKKIETSLDSIMAEM